jgi:hypothetical protein
MKKRTHRSPAAPRKQRPAAALAVFAASILLIDAALVAVAGWILWYNGGSTVVDGSFAGQIGFMAIILIGSTARVLLAYRVRRRQRAHAGLVNALSVASQLAMLGALVAAWLLTDLYYVGWLAALSAIVLLVDSLMRFLVVLAVPVDGRRASRRSELRVSAVPMLVGLAGAAAGLVLTTDIHQWNAVIINGLLIFVGVALLISSGVVAFVSRVAAQRRDLTQLDT